MTREPLESINWILTELLRVAKNNNAISLAELISPENMSGIIKNVKSGDITRVNAKLLFDEIIKTGKDVDSLIRELELSGEVNKKDIVDIVGMLINNNPEILADYANNPDEVLNYFIGNILIHTQGKAKIEHIEPLIIEILKTYK